MTSPPGESVSAEDYEIALVDGIERPALTGRRFRIAN
jgi:putative NADH-flavin reductase